MAGPSVKKRARDDAAKPSKASRPSKKQRKLAAYHSDSDSAAEAEEAADFQAVDLLGSDNEDLQNAHVDDGATSGSDSEASGPGSGPDADAPQRGTKKQAAKKEQRRPQFVARDAPESDDGAPSGREDDADSEEVGSDGDSDGGSEDEGGSRQRRKSKRNDPAAFATSLSKILSTKLSTSRRADPVLARSAAAHEASRQVVDSALEVKARKRLREQKRLAMEKGRVRDVLVATTREVVAVDAATGQARTVVEGESTAQILETERRLRKVAQRGVVKLFNAVRAAQVKAAEAQRLNRVDGVLGVGKREEKITEMSRKGFLDLIASGGGGLKKGGLEEA